MTASPAVTLICQFHRTTDVEILPDEQPWLLRYGVAGKPDQIGHGFCVEQEWRRIASTANIDDIADGNLPEIRKLGTFKAGDQVRCIENGLTATVISPALNGKDVCLIDFGGSRGAWVGPDELELVR